MNLHLLLSRMKRFPCLLQVPLGLGHARGSRRNIPDCVSHTSAPQREHTNLARVIRGLTDETFLARPSMATSLPRWFSLSLRTSTFISWGRLMILRWMRFLGSQLDGMAAWMTFTPHSRHLSGSSRMNVAMSVLMRSMSLYLTFTLLITGKVSAISCIILRYSSLARTSFQTSVTSFSSNCIIRIKPLWSGTLRPPTRSIRHLRRISFPSPDPPSCTC